MSSLQRCAVSWLVAALTAAVASPSAADPTAGPPTKAREVVTQGGPPASLTALERAKAVAAGIRLPAPEAARSGVAPRLSILRTESSRFPAVHPLEKRTTSGERP